MSKRKANNENRNGLPTAILYMGLFAFAGCLVLALFLLVMAVFLWLWMHVCNWTGLSTAIPSHAGRVWLGVLAYLVIALPVCAVLWKNSHRTEAEAVARKTARENKKRRETVAPQAQEQPETPPVADTKPTDIAAEAPLRFDGVYYSQTYTTFRDRDYDPVAHKYRQYRYFLRFNPDGAVAELYDDCPPAEAFAKLATKLGTPAAFQYTLSGRYLEIKSDTQTVYSGSVTGDVLDLSFDDDSHLGYSTRPFSFQAVA